jgi:hypothetical protein
MTAALKFSPAPRYTDGAVIAAVEHHAGLNGRPVTVMSVDFEAGAWIVSLAEASGVTEQRWIEDPRPVDVTQADVFHNGTRLGRIA